MITYLILSALIVIMIVLILRLPENFTENIKKDGINSFDHYLFINLDHRKDRLKQITSELNKMELPKNKITRIKAVHEKYNGHIGCAKSHIKALNLAKKNKYNHVIIFEDDFIFTENKTNVDNKINNFLKIFKGNWDVIQLTAHYKKLDNINIKDIKKVNSASTSSAYIIQNHFYDKLIDNITQSKNKMEKEMIKFHSKNNNKKKKFTTNYALDQHWNNLQKKSKWYIFDPTLGKQSGSSSIMSYNLEGFVSKYKFHTLHI